MKLYEITPLQSKVLGYPCKFKSKFEAILEFAENVSFFVERHAKPCQYEHKYFPSVRHISVRQQVHNYLLQEDKPQRTLWLWH